MSNRGGARANAGRKKVDPSLQRITVSVSISQDTLRALQEEAQKRNTVLGRIVDLLVREHL